MAPLSTLSLCIFPPYILSQLSSPLSYLLLLSHLTLLSSCHCPPHPIFVIFLLPPPLTSNFSPLSPHLTPLLPSPPIIYASSVFPPLIYFICFPLSCASFRFFPCVCACVCVGMCVCVCVPDASKPKRTHRHTHTQTNAHAQGVWKLVHISSNISHLSAQLLSVHLCLSLSLPVCHCVSRPSLSLSLTHTHTHTHEHTHAQQQLVFIFSSFLSGRAAE